MSFWQLYYTSCERGLSGYAGYQFNAITPGTPAETMRQVESLTGYEAPHSLAYATDPGDLAKCPVNLCYVPGPTSIVANVQYVGRDSSRRFGNFFAHALATADCDADFGGVLPVELWQAPFWVAEQAPSLELPDLDGPLPPGSLSRAEAGRFIAAHPHRDQLPAVLSAVGMACAGTGRPVLIVEDVADDVARWFAAVSYLLPARFVQKLSFATYLSRPSHSRLNLLGTISETSTDLGSDAMESFSLFDFPGGRFSNVPEHPLAQLMARIDMPIASALWDWAEVLASGDETSLDDWHPVTTAAAALGQLDVGAADLGVAASWLESATYLPAARQSEIAWALHDHPARGAGELVALREVGRRSGDQALYEQLECELLEADMRRAMSASTETGSRKPIAEATVRERTGARCQEALQQCDSAPIALRLLDWADQVQATLDPEAVIGSTRRVIAPWLGSDVPGQPLEEEFRQRARRLANRWPQFRSGLVICLTGLSMHAQESLPTVLSGLVGELLTEDDLRGHPELVEVFLICTAQRTSDGRVKVLARIAELRGRQPVDERLLWLIWPTGQWTRGEAREVLSGLGPRQHYGKGVPDWFYRATERDLKPADLKLHVSLCHQLLSSPVAKQLSAPQLKELRATTDLDRATLSATTLDDLIPVITAYSRSQSPVVRHMMRSRVAVALTHVDVRTDDLVGVLRKLDVGSFGTYLRNIEGMPTQSGPDLRVHLAALSLLYAAGRLEPTCAESAGRVLDYAGSHWHRKDLEEVARLVEAMSQVAAAQFRLGVEEARSGPARRAVKSAAGRVRSFARSRMSEAGANSADRNAPARDAEPRVSASGTEPGAEPGADRAEPGPQDGAPWTI